MRRKQRVAFALLKPFHGVIRIRKSAEPLWAVAPAGKVSRSHTPCASAGFVVGPDGSLPGLGTLRCDPFGTSAALVEHMRITAVTGSGEISNSIPCRIS